MVSIETMPFLFINLLEVQINIEQKLIKRHHF